MKLHAAQLTDANAIVDLLNSAYRGSIGWTTENEIVAGDRIDQQGVQSEIENQQSDFLIFRRDDFVIACICLQYNGHRAYIGSFAVDPQYQAEGLGKQILNAAEQHAKQRPEISEYAMVVVAERKELIEYYERRGYQKSGQIEPYPDGFKWGTPLVQNLQIVHLVKAACMKDEKCE